VAVDRVGGILKRVCHHTTEERKLIMKSIGLILLGALTACAATTSPTVRVQTDSSAVASFAAYRTFGFGLAEGPPAPFQVSARSFEVQRRMRSLVAAELVRKGYTEQPGPAHPDFVVTLASGYAEQPPVYGGEAPLFETGKTGAIVINAFDASSAAQVWHGVGETEVDREKINDHLLQTGVQSVLASFPTRSSEGRPGVTSKQAP
jgi:hypothetical protein